MSADVGWIFLEIWHRSFAAQTRVSQKNILRCANIAKLAHVRTCVAEALTATQGQELPLRRLEQLDATAKPNDGTPAVN